MQILPLKWQEIRRSIMKNIKKIKGILGLVMSMAVLSACTSPGMNNKDVSGTVTPAENGAGSTSDSANADTYLSNEGASNANTSSAETSDTAQSDSNEEQSSDQSASAATYATIYRDPISNQEPVKDGYLNIVFLGDEQFLAGDAEGNTIPDLMTNRFDYTNIYNLAIKDTTGAIPRSQASTNLSDYKEPSFTAMAHVLAGDIKADTFSSYLGTDGVATCNKIDVETVDYYVIGYGYHDYYNGIESSNENNPEDEHTLHGAIVTGIKIIQEVSPNAQFIVCSPYYCRFFDENGKDIGDAFSVTKGLNTLAVYANETVLAADQCTNTLKLPAISGTLFDLNGHTYTQYLESDGLTMNLKGRRIYTDALARVIKYHLGFIGEEEANKTITIADYN